MIDNFEIIENHLLNFHLGQYYKFEALVRNTDGNNPLYCEGCSNTNKNILIKSWWIEDGKYYSRIKNEMKTLCDMTGARLYVVLDRMDLKKTLTNLYKLSSDLLVSSYVVGSDTNPSPKTVLKLTGTASSIKESSNKDSRMWMFDVDSKDPDLLDYIQCACQPCKHFVLESVKGYHVCVFKSNGRFFNKEVFYTQYPYLWEKKDLWSLSENSMGLVYVPDKAGA